jgi:hypothetical protein
MIRLFDIQNGVVTPTEHCYALKDLAIIMDAYPEDYANVYAYLFYMTCPNPDLNPFFEVAEHEKEELIFSQLPINFSTEDDVVLKAKVLCEKLYQTATFRAYMGIKSMLDRLAKYMETTEIQHGRDGNINSLVNAASKFEQIRLSFKGAYKDLMEEQKSQVRGNAQIAYDQEK